MAGIDFIQTNYPLKQTQQGFAFSVPSETAHAETRKRARSGPTDTHNSGDRQEDTQLTKRVKKEEKESKDNGVFASVMPGRDDEEEGVLPSSVGVTSAAKAAVQPDYASLNLWQEIYRRDTRVLQEDCACHACGNGYTRSYIHHLLLSRELLADVLLYQHNTFQLKQLFEEAPRLMERKILI